MTKAILHSKFPAILVKSGRAVFINARWRVNTRIESPSLFFGGGSISFALFAISFDQVVIPRLLKLFGCHVVFSLRT